MRNQSALSSQFQRKISTFCDVRVAPLVSPRELNNIRPYLLSLIIYRKYPPTRSGRTDWLSIQAACGLETVMSSALRKTLQSGLEAIVRWIDREQSGPDDESSTTKVAKMARRPKDGRSTSSDHAGLPRGKTGVPPKPIEAFPEPLFDASEDPIEFASALMYHMRRHGDSDWHLHRAIADRHPGFERSTLVSWRKGTKSPRTVDSLEVLSSFERRYRLRSGYFKAKLPHQSRSASGFELASEVSAAERRRLAWHLPDDFNTLPFAKREEILEWVRRVIITGSTDYRRFQATASKQRYAIRFPAISYGSTLSPRLVAGDEVGETDHASIRDPDLLAGVIDAPPRLSMEMANLVHFKTATLTAVGFQRSGVWGEETTSQKIEHLGLMFGSLAASPKGAVKGYGVPLAQLTFGLLVLPTR